MLQNSAGKIYYGMHFYPGVAEYKDGPNNEPYRIFINESTIRGMGPSFSGRPIFVDHVDGVESSIDELRKEADGWVIESFYNAADGKTWAKFIVTSKRGEDAIRKGFKLSNAYVPKSFGAGGLWNGVSYAKEVTSGEFEHLAIVRSPRYEESRIMTPDEFKTYNEENALELKRLANSKDEKKESKAMSGLLKFFKREAVNNGADLESTMVMLPKSGKEVLISKLVNDMDEMEMNAGKEMMANGDHKVMVGEKKMSINELLGMHKQMNDELDLLKEKKGADKAGAKAPDIASMDNKDDLDGDVEAAKKKALMLEKKEVANVDDAGAEKKELANEESDEEKEAKKKKEKDEEDEKAKKNAHFNALKNAPLKNSAPVVIELSEDRVLRGKRKYGSN